MPFIIRDKTNWEFLLVIVSLTVIIGGGILFYQYWWLPKEAKELSSVETINQFYLNNEIDFPIYSKAILISTEFIPPCEEPMWLSYCNVKVYTWRMESNYQQIDNWFLKETNKAGWDCFFGNKKIRSGWQTECDKNNLTYGVKLSTDQGMTKVIIFVPQ